MSLKVILTLVVAFLFVVFGLFNTEIVTLNLIGFKKVSLPISVLIFFVFLMGAAYAAVLSLQMQIEQALRIKSLKKKIQDLKSVSSHEDQESPATGSDWKISSGAKETVAQQTSGQVAIPRKRASVPQNGTSGATKDALTDETPEPVTLRDDDEDEGGLSSQLREIAIRRIQNG